MVNTEPVPPNSRMPEPKRTMPVISAAAVTKSWGTNVVLNNVTVDVLPGITGLLGSNGAGKTTFLGMALGLHQPDSGSLQVLGEDPALAGPMLRQRIGYSPEHHDLPPDIPAQDLVRHLAEVHGLPRREATTRASDSLWLVGLGEERARPVGTMSTGQRQRVKLAQAIAHDPALILLDEPTDGLDPVQRDDMLALIRRIGTEFGISIMLSSHLLEEVERVADNAVILNNQRVVASGPISQLRGDRTGVIVEVDSGVEQLGQFLEQAGAQVAVQQRRLVVDSEHPDASLDGLLDLVRDAAAAVGSPIRRMHPAESSLEELFLAELDAGNLVAAAAGSESAS